MLEVLHGEWDRDLEQTARLRAMTTPPGAGDTDEITDEETMDRARSLVALAVS